MASAIRKSITLNLSGDGFAEEITVDVTWQILEKVERVYATGAESVAAIHLADPMRVQRHQLARVIALWVQGKTKLNNDQIHEAVLTAPFDQIIRLAGKIQAAVLWSVRGADGKPQITDFQFDELSEGRDIEITAPTPTLEPAKKEAKSLKKRTSATSKKPIA